MGWLTLESPRMMIPELEYPECVYNEGEGEEGTVSLYMLAGTLALEALTAVFDVVSGSMVMGVASFTLAALTPTVGNTTVVLSMGVAAFTNGAYVPVIDVSPGADNIIINGDFSSGTANWYGLGATITGVTTLYVNADGTSPYPRTYQYLETSPAAASKMYLRFKHGVSNTACTSIDAYLYGGTSVYACDVDDPIINTWYETSEVVTIPSGWTAPYRLFLRHVYPDAATASGKQMRLQEVLLIDLTATFGAGNEPTAAECDTLFPDWF